MNNLQSFEMFNENVKFVKLVKKADKKTDTYNVLKDDTIIGQIKWSSRARGYAFLPTEDCSAEIKEFVKDLMIKRRMLKKKEKLNEDVVNIQDLHDKINLTSLQKELLSKALEELMTKYSKMASLRRDEKLSAYADGVSDGLNHAFKLINNIDDDYNSD